MPLGRKSKMKREDLEVLLSFDSEPLRQPMVHSVQASLATLCHKHIRSYMGDEDTMLPRM